MDKNTTVIAGAIIVAAIIVAAAILIAVVRIHSTGTVKSLGVDVYTDPECTIKAIAIDWGNLAAGDSSSYNIYVRLSGNTPAKLTLSTENWNPEIASQYILISWDYNNATLAPTQAYKITITCTILAQVTGVTNFSNDILISATEHK